MGPSWSWTPATPPREPPADPYDGPERPGSRYADDNTWGQILTPDGAECMGTSRSGITGWARPGLREEGRKPHISATTGAVRNCIHVLSTDWKNLPPGNYTKLGYLAATRFGGDTTEGIYDAGRYVDALMPMKDATSELLGDAYRPTHLATVADKLGGRLHGEGRRTTRQVDGWLPLRNGLLDPDSLLLHPHTPDRLDTVQHPVEWDSEAVCPVFDAWLTEPAGGRGEDLMEAAALMFDRTGRQRQSLYLWGPPRSGKGTFLRVLKEIAGAEHTTALSLHQLAGDRFAVGRLQYAVLNCAADLSANHIEDISMFKMLTGGDMVPADVKYGKGFDFECRTMFAFSSNEIPTVNDPTGAFLTRIRAYEFNSSFLGRDNPAVETAILMELPGILVRLVEALARFRGRGGYQVNAASLAAEEAFARQADRVRLFLWEASEPDAGGWVTRGELSAAFGQWAQLNRRAPMSAHRLYASMEPAGYRPAIRRGTRGFVGLSLRDSEEGVGQIEEKRGRTAPSAPEHQAVTLQALTELVAVGLVQAVPNTGHPGRFRMAAPAPAAAAPRVVF